MGYCCPTLFKHAKKYVKNCDNYQWIGRLVQEDEIPLQEHVFIDPFENWSLYFLGPITPMPQYKWYIFVCIDYFTKWVEAKYIFHVLEKAVVDFLFEHSFTHFGVPMEMIRDQIV